AWILGALPHQGEKYTGFASPIDFTTVNCRAFTGARPFMKSERVYAEMPVWYLYAGCNPLFAPAPPNTYWRLQVKGPLWGIQALRALEAWHPGSELRVVCNPRETQDPVCSYARSHGRCAPAGQGVLACLLDEGARKEILAPAGR